MESGHEKSPRAIGHIEDPAFLKAIENQVAFLARLESATSYEDIVHAIETAAVDDGAGELVVFNIEGYEEGYEDEMVEATTVSLDQLKSAVEFVKNNGAQDSDEVHDLVQNTSVASAVSRILFGELVLDKEQPLHE